VLGALDVLEVPGAVVDEDEPDFCAPGEAMTKIPTARMTKIPAAANATFLLFKLD
jgi:hypothetical protein